MKLACPNCAANYEFESHKIPSTGLSIKCYQCAQRFDVLPPQATPTPNPQSAANLTNHLFSDGGFGFDMGDKAPDPLSNPLYTPSATKPQRPQRPKKKKKYASTLDQGEFFVDLPKPVSTALPKAFNQIAAPNQSLSNLPQPSARQNTVATSYDVVNAPPMTQSPELYAVQSAPAESPELYAVQSAPAESPELYAVQSAPAESPELYAVQSAPAESPELYAVQSAPAESPELYAVQSAPAESPELYAVQSAPAESPQLYAEQSPAPTTDAFNFDGLSALFDQGEAVEERPYEFNTNQASPTSLFGDSDAMFDFAVDRNADFNQPSPTQDLPTSNPIQTVDSSTSETNESFSLELPEEVVEEIEEPYIQPISEDSDAYDLSELIATDELHTSEQEALEDIQDTESQPTQQKTSNNALLILLLLLLASVLVTYWQYPEVIQSFLQPANTPTISKNVKLKRSKIVKKTERIKTKGTHRGSSNTHLTSTLSDKKDQVQQIQNHTKPNTHTNRDILTSSKSRQSTKKQDQSQPAKSKAWYQVNKALKERFTPEKNSRNAFQATLNTPSSLDIVHFRNKAKELRNQKEDQTQQVEKIARGLLHFNTPNDPLIEDAQNALRELSTKQLKTPEGVRAQIAFALAQNLDGAQEQAIALGLAFPKDAVAQELMGHAYEKRGQTKAAEQAFAQAHTLQPNLATARLKHAQLAINNGHFKQASKELAYLSKQKLNSPAVLRTKAEAALKDQNHKQAYGWIQNLFEAPKERVNLKEKSKVMMVLADSIQQEIEKHQDNEEHDLLIELEQSKQNALRDVVKTSPDDKEALSKLTTSLIQSHNLKTALSDLNELEKSTGGSASISIQKSNVLDQMDRKEKSLNTLEDAIKKYPRDLSLHLHFTEELIQRKAFNRAHEVLDRMRLFHAEHPDLTLAYSNLMVKEARVKEANAFLKQAIAEKPWVPQLRKGLADLKWKLANSSGQERFMQEALEVYTQSLDLNPGLHQARLQRARSLLSLKQPQKALADLERLQKEESFAKKIDFELGQAKQALGNSKEARTHFLRVLKKNPNHLESLRAMGKLSKKLGKKVEAKQYLEQALAVSQRDAETRFELGMISLKEKNIQTAMRHLKVASEVKQQNPTLQYWYGRALEASKDPKLDAEIKTVYENAATLVKQNQREKESPELCDTHYRVGLAHRKQTEELSLALNDFTRASECAPDRADIWTALAQLHDQLGDQKKSSEYYQTALKKNKKYAPALLGIAKSYLRQSPPKTKKALKTLQKTLKADRTQYEAYYHICAIQQSRARRIAKKNCRRYLKAQPKGEYAENAKEIIRSF